MTVTPPSITAAAAAHFKNKNKNNKTNKSREQDNTKIGHDEHFGNDITPTQDKERQQHKTQTQTSIMEFTGNNTRSTTTATTTSTTRDSTSLGNTIRTRTRQTKLDDHEQLRVSDFKKNEPWGAFSWIPPDEATFRITFQNVRGLPYSKHGLTYDELFQTMKDRFVNIFGCVETNVDWKI